MKHMIYGIALLVVTIMVIAGALIVSGRDVRENETDKALNTAVEQTLDQLKKYGSYEIGNEQELIADFQQSLLMHISSDASIQVKILTADTKKGVLDVEITETYKTVNNKKTGCLPKDSDFRRVFRKTRVLHSRISHSRDCL